MNLSEIENGAWLNLGNAEAGDVLRDGVVQAELPLCVQLREDKRHEVLLGWVDGVERRWGWGVSVHVEESSMVADFTGQSVCSVLGFLTLARELPMGRMVSGVMGRVDPKSPTGPSRATP